MAASPNDKIKRTGNGDIPVVATVQASRGAGVDSLSVDTQQFWPILTGISFSTYKVDTNNDKIVGTQIDWQGVSNGTNAITSMIRTGGAADIGNVFGDKVQMGPTAQWGEDLIEAFLKEHTNPLGGHGAITPTSVASSGPITAPSMTTTTLTVGGKDVSQLTPSGSTIMFAGSAAPTGWLLCDGSAVSRTTYASLFSAVGTTWGIGDGSTTFNLPNFLGRTPFGVDNAQTEFATLAQTGGQKSLQYHSHGVSDPGHRHTLWSVGQEGNSYPLSGPSTRVVLTGGNPDAGNGVTGLSGTGIGIQATGSGGNNLNPYVSINFIIKV